MNRKVERRFSLSFFPVSPSSANPLGILLANVVSPVIVKRSEQVPMLVSWRSICGSPAKLFISKFKLSSRSHVPHRFDCVVSFGRFVKIFKRRIDAWSEISSVCGWNCFLFALLSSCQDLQAGVWHTMSFIAQNKPEQIIGRNIWNLLNAVPTLCGFTFRPQAKVQYNKEQLNPLTSLVNTNTTGQCD